MTRDDIIRMAREAGGRFFEQQGDYGTWDFMPQELERFAQLVAAAEREACAKVCEVSPEYEDWEIQCGAEGRQLLNDMAEAIRARGQQ